MKKISMPACILFVLIAMCLWVGVILPLTPAVYLLITGDFPGQHIFYGLAEDDPIVVFMLSVSQFVH